MQSGELGKALELAKKEMGGERKKRISLERECAVYQSQLEVRKEVMVWLAGGVKTVHLNGWKRSHWEGGGGAPFLSLYS